MSHKIAGCCSICDKEVYEVISRHPNGEPKQLGKPKGAITKTFVLMDGTNMRLTFCEDCEVDPRIYPWLWRKILKTFAEKEMPTTPQGKAWLLGMTNNNILGILYDG